ncbi:MAG: hypothetical protein IKO27_01655 [Ruminococcus sp.]|nr:hypothetical protein [Ruminococcus sp.]
MSKKLLISLLSAGALLCSSLPAQLGAALNVSADGAHIYEKEYSAAAENKQFKRFFSLVREDGNIPIPGLVTTDQGRFGTSGHMVPQGVCMTDRYCLISAYCYICEHSEDDGRLPVETPYYNKHKKESPHHSVIYIIDRESGSLLSTAVLRDNSHTGGIAYDPYNEVIWIARGRQEDGKVLDAVELSEFNRLASSGKAVGEIKNYAVKGAAAPDNSCASYVTCYDGLLWVGTYSDDADLNTLTGYRTEKTKSGKIRLTTVVKPVRLGVSGTNGAVFFSSGGQTYLAVSSSFSREKSSKLHLFWADLSDRSSLGLVAHSVTDAPNMMQELDWLDGILYAGFESASQAYFNRGESSGKLCPIDSVCALDSDKLLGRSIEDSNVSIPYQSYSYTGEEIKPAVTVKLGDKTLTEGKDYTVRYTDNVNVGHAGLTVIGKGKYCGAVRREFLVKPAKQKIRTACSRSGGIFLKWVKDKSAVGYEVLYARDKNFTEELHSYTITDTDKKYVSITRYPKLGDTWYIKVRSFMTPDGDPDSVRYGNYSDTVKVTVKGNMSAAEIPKEIYTYTGSAITPSIRAVTDIKDTPPGVSEYDVKCENNTGVGIARITVTGTGQYQGKVVETFVIKPEKNEIVSLSSDEPDSFTVGWKKAVEGTTGYQIVYARDIEFTDDRHSTTVRDLDTLSRTIDANVEGGEVWYVKVRSFVTDGKARYGSYSDPQAVVIKQSEQSEVPS